jgi:hypothetical protein
MFLTCSSSLGDHYSPAIESQLRAKREGSGQKREQAQQALQKARSSLSMCQGQLEQVVGERQRLEVPLTNFVKSARSFEIALVSSLSITLRSHAGADGGIQEETD